MEEFLASLDPWMVYLLVGALAFGESAAFLGLVLPGEVALVGAAALGVSVGLDPVPLGLVAAVSASLGGIAGYAIGKRYGVRLLSWQPLARRICAPMARLSHSLSKPSAAILVALGRFNQVTRAAVPALAGMVPMNRVRFAVANTVGAVLWAAAFTSIGYLAAEWWRRSSGDIHLIAAICVAGAVVTWLIIKRLRPSSYEEMTDLTNAARSSTDPRGTSTSE